MAVGGYEWVENADDVSMLEFGRVEYAKVLQVQDTPTPKSVITTASHVILFCQFNMQCEVLDTLEFLKINVAKLIYIFIALFHSNSQ